MQSKKTISVLIPTYNERENIGAMCAEVVAVFGRDLPQYDYEIVIIDNKSKDDTRAIISGLCEENKRIKAIFNSKNFGQLNSPYYGLLQTTGDCTILLCADFQDPVEMLPEFVHQWEQGYKVVCGIKTKSKESRIMYLLRSFHYKTIRRMSAVEQIEHFTGFGLYDHSFIEVLRKLDDATPYLRGIVSELGPERKDIPYTQQRRKGGKTNNNLYSLFDIAMLSFTSYTKVGMRIAIISGMFLSAISLVIALIYLAFKLVFWDRFVAGTVPILLGVFVFGSVQLFFTGLLGEYIMNINTRVMGRPLVVEDKRINFEQNKEEIEQHRP